MQIFKDPADGGGSIAVPQESQHEFTLYKVYGEQDFPAFRTFNGIHFNDRTVRPVGKESLEIIPVPADAAGFVDFKGIMAALPGAVAYFSGKIDIPGGKDTGIYIVIDTFFGIHDLILIVDTDMVDRLTLPDQRGDKIVQLTGFLFRNAESGAGFGAYYFILSLCGRGRIQPFFKCALTAFFTSVADIRRFIKLYADGFGIIRAVQMTSGAEAAPAVPAVDTVAQICMVTGKTICAVVKRSAHTADLLIDQMRAYLLRDRSAVPVEFPADGFE